MARNDPAETPKNPLYDSAGATTYIGAGSQRTLERWRATGDGPAYVKVGHRVRYRRSALDRWLRQRTRTQTKEGERLLTVDVEPRPAA